MIAVMDVRCTIRAHLDHNPGDEGVRAVVLEATGWPSERTHVTSWRVDFDGSYSSPCFKLEAEVALAQIVDQAPDVRDTGED